MHSHIQPTNLNVVGITQNSLPIQGLIKLPLKTADITVEHNFIVCDLLEYDFLIGMDVISVMNLVIDIASRKIISPNGEQDFIHKPVPINKTHKISFDIQTYGQYEKGESKLMNTNTDILRNNFSLSHQSINQKKWNYNQSITTNNYSRNYVQIRPWGDLEKDDTTSEEYIEYELLLNRKFGSNELSTGVEIYNALYISDRVSFGKQKIMNHSVFGQYDFNIQNYLSAIFGLRMDDYSEYSSEYEKDNKDTSND